MVHGGVTPERGCLGPIVAIRSAGARAPGDWTAPNISKEQLPGAIEMRHQPKLNGGLIGKLVPTFALWPLPIPPSGIPSPSKPPASREAGCKTGIGQRLKKIRHVLDRSWSK